MKYVTIPLEAARIVFAKRRYIIAVFALMVALASFIVFVPVVTIPGNDILFQLSIMPKSDHLIILLVSFLTAFSLTYNLYLVRRNRNNYSESVGNATVSGFAGIASSFFGTITCISCATTIIGVLGVGTVAFLYQYRPLLATISIAILVVSLYLTSKKVLKLCGSCYVKAK